MGPLTIFFFPGVSLLAIVPLQPRSHQCRANTTTAVTCGRINTHHRRCGVSTLTATMTAAAGTSLQRWQHRHHCLGRSNNRRKTVTAPMTMARWPPFFFLVRTLSLSWSLIGQLSAPSGHCTIAVMVPPRLSQHPHRHRGHINALGPSLPPQHHCSHHHHARVSTLTVGQQPR